MKISRLQKYILPSLGRGMGVGLLLLLLGGCTLSMEEWVLAEEDRGMDEPYTEHTEFGDVTYQFQDSVMHLTEGLQDQYLIKVEHDTILYINGDIPSKYRPYVGQKIMAGYGYEFPQSLMGRVISVEDVGGILKVTTTAATRDEVFKHLSYDLEYEGMMQNIGVLGDLTDEELENLGYQRLEDSTIVSWDIYDSIQISKGNQKTIERVRRRVARLQKTRADKERYEEIKDETKNILSFGLVFTSEKSGYYLGVEDDKEDRHFLSFPDALYKAYKELVLPKRFQGTFDPSLKISCKVDQFVHSKSVRDESQDMEMHYTDTRNIVTVGVEAGLTHSFLEDGGEDGPKDYEDFINKMKNYNSLSEKAKNALKSFKEVNNAIEPEKSLKKLTNSAGVEKGGKRRAFPMNGVEGSYTIPLGAWFSLKFSVKLEPICEISGVGEIEIVATSKTKRSGTFTMGDYCTKYGEKPEEDYGKPEIKVTKLVGKLSGEIGYSGRVAAAFEFAHTVGVEVGLNLKAAVSASIGVDFAGLWDENEGSIKIADGSGVRAAIEFWADARFYVEPLGFSLWETSLGEWPDPHAQIMSVGFGIDPEVEWGEGSSFTTHENADGTQDLNAYVAMNYKDLGLTSVFNTDHPLMRMYTGPISNGKFVYATPVESKDDPTPVNPREFPAAKTGKTYHYRYQGTIEKGITEVHFVPALVSWKFRDYLLDRDWDYNVRHYLKDGGEILVEDEYPMEIGDPAITTLKSQQLYAGPCKDASIFEGSGTYVSSSTGKKTSTGGNYTADPSKYSDFKFMTQVKVYRGSEMRSGWLDVYFYNTARKQIGSKPLKVPIDNLKSGTYTYIFNFTTDWRPTGAGSSTITSGEDDDEATGVEGEYLFYRVIPHWIDNNTTEKVTARDSKSRKYYTLEYPLKEVKVDPKDTEKWGTVMPEKNLNQ